MADVTLSIPRARLFIQNVVRYWQQNRATLLLLAPLLIYMAVVFAIPVSYQLAFAFYSRILYKGVLWMPVPDFTLVNFARAVSEAEYINSLTWTLGVAIFTSVVSMSLALPVTYFLARYNTFGRSFIELSFLLPILVKYLPFTCLPTRLHRKARLTGCS